MNSKPNQLPSAAELVWSCVEEGFYVASCSGKFLGFVDQVDRGAFQVCDARSQQIGLFKDLAAAMRCLILHTGADSASPVDGIAQ